MHDPADGLETKFVALSDLAETTQSGRLAGYASLFGRADRSGDVVEQGAFAASLARLEAASRRVKLLWQHDPAQPIGVWERVVEDTRGLHVSGRLLPEVAKGREAIALLAAQAVDGLSIGYRVVRAERGQGGGRRLIEIDLWEVSLVTFPMLPGARAGLAATATARAAPKGSFADFQNALAEMLAER